MSKKVSNSAKREEIEQEFGCTYLYPNLYTPESIIDGTEESTISVITSENPDFISFAIWGMLPDQYEDEWRDFQNALDTLNATKEMVESSPVFGPAFLNRRCLIIVTGYFVYHLKNGVLYPYYVRSKSLKPFCLAGIYNTLEDGFITCSLLNTKVSGVIEKIQNIEDMMPIPIDFSFYADWLNPSSSLETINRILDVPNQIPLTAHPIAKEFFKNGITYDGMLQPVYYKDIPKV